MVKDYYVTLGVEKTATPDQIKQAYRRLASKFHPDKGGSTEKFQEIQEAYDTLSDPNKRAQYDRPQPQVHFHSNMGPNGFNFDDIFNMFGVNMREHQRQSVDPRVTLWIDLVDVARGGPKLINLQYSGQTNAIEINIPQGIQDGDSVRYAKLGPNGRDLVITFKIKPHPTWQQDGVNLHTQLTVDFWTLIVGGSVPVTDLLGATLMLTIPPNTNPGSTLRMRGRGLPPNSLPGRGGNVGDLLIRIQGRIPDNISPELLEAIKQEQSR